MTSIFSPPKVTICVGAVVLRHQKLLFVRQTYGENLKGKWSLPWGFVDGKKIDGSPEPPDAAAIREIKEEAGVIAEVDGLLGVQNHVSNDGELRLYVIFLCRHISGEPTPDNYETDRAAYFSLNEIESSSEPYDAFCKWIACRVLQNQHRIMLPESQNPYSPHLAFF